MGAESSESMRVIQHMEHPKIAVKAESYLSAVFAAVEIIPANEIFILGTIIILSSH